MLSKKALLCTLILAITFFTISCSDNITFPEDPVPVKRLTKLWNEYYSQTFLYKAGKLYRYETSYDYSIYSYTRNRIPEIELYVSGDPENSRRNIYYYDEKGKVTKLVYFDIKGSFKGFSLFYYDNKDQLIRHTYSPNERETFRLEYIYDNRGNVIEYIGFQNDSLYEHAWAQYDNNINPLYNLRNIILRPFNIFSKNNPLFYKYESHEITSGSFSVTYTYSYDNDGYPLTRVREDENGAMPEYYAYEQENHK